MPSPGKRRGRPRQTKTGSRSGNPAVRGQQPVPGVPQTPPPSTAVRAGGARATVEAEFDAGYALPVEGAEYPQILRNPAYVLARSVLGVIFGLALFLLLTSVVSQSVVALFWATTAAATPYRAYVSAAYAFQRPTGMLAVNLGIATLIPISWALILMIHRVRPHWLFSVKPGIRWRYLLLCLGVATVALNGVLALSTLFAPAQSFAVQKGFWGFLAVIILTSPLQAAAEEIFFRGYLMQALGSLVAAPWFGVVVSSVVFALLHGVQNLPLFVDRLAFGLLAAVLVWRTGGLEAGIAAHVINNVFAYVIAGLTTSIAALKAVQHIGWLDAAFDVGGFALFAVLALLLARKLKLQRQVDLAGARDAQGRAGLQTLH